MKQKMYTDVTLDDDLNLFCECGAGETAESKGESNLLIFECGAAFEPGEDGEWLQIAPCGKAAME